MELTTKQNSRNDDRSFNVIFSYRHVDLCVCACLSSIYSTKNPYSITKWWVYINAEIFLSYCSVITANYLYALSIFWWMKLRSLLCHCCLLSISSDCVREQIRNHDIRIGIIMSSKFCHAWLYSFIRRWQFKLDTNSDSTSILAQLFYYTK